MNGLELGVDEGGLEERRQQVIVDRVAEIAEPIIARLVDNRIIPEPPVFRNGEIENIDELGGYGPFLQVACRRDEGGRSTFPDTYGAGIGIERMLWAMLRGPEVERIEDVTCFGKNPDGHGLYLF